MPGINDEAFGRIDGVATKSSRELAEELGTHKETITAVKAGRRGMSPGLAKSVAMKSGEKPATVYIKSQSAALKQKIKAEQINLMGVVDTAQMALKAVNTKFTPDQIDRSDQDFRQAVLELRAAAQKALELLGDGNESMGDKAANREYMEPTRAVGDSTAVATKGSTRDLHGKAIPEDEKIERDAYGKRLR